MRNFPYKILIPSYQRAGRASTIDFLRGGVYGCEDIIVSTQTEDDYQAYKKAYAGKATIIYREGNSVGDNRNTLLEWAQKNGVSFAVMLDDDIRSFRFMNGKRITTPEQAHELFLRCFWLASGEGSPLWGCYPCDNRLSMKPKVRCTLLTGTLLGFLDTTLRFDNRYRIKEDYELSLRLMRQGRKVLRFDSFGVTAQHKTEGGCFADWGNQGRYADMLVEQYPELCEIDKKKKHKEIKLKKLI